MIRHVLLDGTPAVRWGRIGTPVPFGPLAGRSHREALDVVCAHGRRLAAQRLVRDRAIRVDAARRRVAPKTGRPRFSPAITTLYEDLLHARVRLAEGLLADYGADAIRRAQRELDARRGDARLDSTPWTELSNILRVVREVLARTGGDADGLEYIARELAEDTTDGTDRELSRLFNIPLATAAGSQEQVDAWVKANVGLVKGVGSSAIEELERIIAEGAAGGTPTLDLRQTIQDRFGVSYSKASFWARDQTAKLGAQIARAQKERYGVTRYQWSTSGDARVRQEHAELDGKIFAYAEPPVADRAGTKGNPGEVWQCRCVDLAVMPDEDPAALLAEAEAQQERELAILQVSPTVQGLIANRSGFSDWNARRIAQLRAGARSAVGL
jgi:SPP1 gp7 family putative phage head morphogenesis protein